MTGEHTDSLEDRRHKLSVTKRFQWKRGADVEGDLEEGGDTGTQAQR